MATTKERLDKHDREIRAIRALLHQGMRMLTRTDAALERLTAAQERTDASLKAFIDSLKRGGNGHTKTRVH